MSHSLQNPRKYRFGIFEADLASGELRRAGIRVRIQSQPFKLLAAMIEQPGEVLSRELLQQKLWGSDTTVDYEHSLGIAINKLREALGDSAENPRFVETLSKRGYRFICPVNAIEESEPPAPSQPPLPAQPAVPEPQPAPAAAAAPTRPACIWPWLTAAATCLALSLALMLLLRPPLRKPYRVAQITFTDRVLSNDISDLEIGSFSGSASDGTRLYFSELNNGSMQLAVALVANGEISHLLLPPEIGDPLIGSLSPDGSRLVVRGRQQTAPEQPLWIVPTLGGDPRRVPNVLAHDAVWMPDNQHLLVASRNELLIVSADGSDSRHLASTPGMAYWLRWSPDARHLRFTLRNFNQQTSELWEMNADGSGAHPLLAGWNQPAAECCGSWTPDGKYFVFQSQHEGHGDIWALREGWPHLGPPTPRQITNGPLTYEAPSTTPGSDRIHFIGVDTQFQLLHQISGQSSFAPLEPNLSSASLAEYSRDGQWVAWLNASDGSLWRSRANGAERVQLTAPPVRVFNLKWSPDAHRLAIMAKEPGQPWRIYLIDKDGGKLAPLLNEEHNEADPDWSPDGRTLVFGRLPDRMDTQQPKAIYLLDVDSHKFSQIPGSEGLFSPRFSPDGHSIAALRMDQHALMLYQLPAARWSTVLTNHGVGDQAWSHDGKYIYFQDYLEPGKPIYRVTMPSGNASEVARIASLRPITATDYRLVGLAPGDLPIVSAHTSTINLYGVDLNEK